MNVEEPVIECESCQDTGFRPCQCAGLGPVNLCGRRRRHFGHEFVVPCECVPMNRTLQEKRQRSQRSAA